MLLVVPLFRLSFACLAIFAVKTRFDLRQPAIVDKIFEGVLGGILGRFFPSHRPWRWRPGGFFTACVGGGRESRRGFALFCRFLRVFGRFLGAFCGNFGLLPSMSCAYLYVHNFPPTRVSGFRRANLAFDKETVFDGRGLTAKGAKDAKGESGDDKRRKAKPPQGRRARRNWAGKISHLTKKQRWTAGV